MLMKQIQVMKENVWDILNDKEVYVLKPWLTTDGYHVQRIQDCSIEDILGDNCVVFKLV